MCGRFVTALKAVKRSVEAIKLLSSLLLGKNCGTKDNCIGVRKNRNPVLRSLVLCGSR